MDAATLLPTKISASSEECCCSPAECPSWGPKSPTNFGGPNYLFPQDPLLFGLIHGILRLLIGLFGMPSNAFLLLVTWKNKELWTSSGILLAIVALCDFVVSASALITFYFGVTGNVRIDQKVCFLAMSPATIAFVFMSPLLFVLGLDRLLNILFPFWDPKIAPKYYISILLTPSVVASAYIYVSGLIYIVLYSNNGVAMRFLYCSVEINFFGHYGLIAGNIALVFNVATIACYTILYVAIKFYVKMRHQNTQEAGKRILKSLMALVAVYIFCWIFTQLVKYYFLRYLPPNFLAISFSALCGIIIALSQTMNTPILYGTSQLYREIMRKEAKKLLSFGAPTAGSQNGRLNQMPAMRQVNVQQQPIQ